MNIKDALPNVLHSVQHMNWIRFEFYEMICKLEMVTMQVTKTFENCRNIYPPHQILNERHVRMHPKQPNWKRIARIFHVDERNV